MAKNKKSAVQEEEEQPVPLAPGSRVLLMQTVDGEKRITLPPNALVTFGPAIPFPKNGDRYVEKHEYALRVYIGKKENLVAVFAGVREFRDVTIPVAKLVVREAGKSVWKSDEDGYSVQTDVKRSKKLVPDVALLNPAPDADDTPF